MGSTEVSNKLEQPSGSTAEVSNSAKDSPETVAPDYAKQCFQLVSVPDYSKPHEPDVRCFYLNDTRVFFGIVLSETSDSFLVGASSRLVQDPSKEISCEPMIPMPVARIFKSSLCMVTAPVLKYKYYYFKYLQQKGRKLLPDYLAGGVLEKVSDFIQTFNEGDSEPNAVSSASKSNEGFERKRIPGASEHAFTPILTSEKIH